jgi:hypothetical protein
MPLPRKFPFTYSLAYLDYNKSQMRLIEIVSLYYQHGNLQDVAHLQSSMANYVTIQVAQSYGETEVP